MGVEVDGDREGDGYDKYGEQDEAHIGHNQQGHPLHQAPHQGF